MASVGVVTDFLPVLTIFRSGHDYILFDYVGHGCVLKIDDGLQRQRRRRRPVQHGGGGFTAAATFDEIRHRLKELARDLYDSQYVQPDILRHATVRWNMEVVLGRLLEPIPPGPGGVDASWHRDGYGRRLLSRCIYDGLRVFTLVPRQRGAGAWLREEGMAVECRVPSSDTGSFSVASSSSSSSWSSSYRTTSSLSQATLLSFQATSSSLSQARSSSSSSSSTLCQSISSSNGIAASLLQDPPALSHQVTASASSQTASFRAPSSVSSEPVFLAFDIPSSSSSSSQTASASSSDNSSSSTYDTPPSFAYETESTSSHDAPSPSSSSSSSTISTSSSQTTTTTTTTTLPRWPPPPDTCIDPYLPTYRSDQLHIAVKHLDLCTITGTIFIYTSPSPLTPPARFTAVCVRDVSAAGLRDPDGPAPAMSHMLSTLCRVNTLRNRSPAEHHASLCVPRLLGYVMHRNRGRGNRGGAPRVLAGALLEPLAGARDMAALAQSPRAPPRESLRAWARLVWATMRWMHCNGVAWGGAAGEGEGERGRVLWRSIEVDRNGHAWLARNFGGQGEEAIESDRAAMEELYGDLGLELE